jgi:hypothetical protein
VRKDWGPGQLAVAGIAITLLVSGVAMTADPALGWSMAALGFLMLIGVFVWRLKEGGAEGPLRLQVLSKSDGTDIWPCLVATDGEQPDESLVLMLSVRVQNPTTHTVQLNEISVELYDVRRGPQWMQVRMKFWPKKLPTKQTRSEIDELPGRIDFPKSIRGGEHLDVYVQQEYHVGQDVALSSRFHRIVLRVETPAGDSVTDLPADLLPA